MTPTEIQAALAEIAAPFPKGYASMSIDATTRDAGMKQQRIRLVLYPEDITGRRCVRVEADDFADGIEKLRAAVEAEREALDAETVHKLALTIIELADTDGGVTEAALRLVASREQIARLQGRALARANEMASRGPFSIRETASANAPDAMAGE